MAPIEKATLGGGCFWCLEAVFQRLEGVSEVVSGYAGGETPDPTYRAVCSGSTGHAEVVQVTFDPNVISFDSLLTWFWQAHDPTTLNRQGADVGTQYRSIILTHSPEQDQIARKQINVLNVAGRFSNPIVTQVMPLTRFYKAEVTHQDYYNNNKQASYCTYVIQPKLDKLSLKP